MISRIFIDRPVLSSVISLIIVLAGLAGIFSLPIAQFPEITPPVVSVTAVYNGATADTLQKTVAAPIEDKVNGVENMIYMESNSAANGTMTLNVFFEIGTDTDQAATNVNNRVQQATAILPDEVKKNGITVQKKSTNMLEIITLTSPSGQYDTVYLSNYAYLNVVNALKRLPGVGDASIIGAQDYSMRVWLRPDRMAELGITPTDLANAIREQNAQFAVGKVGDTPTAGIVDFTYTMTTQGRMTEPEQFEKIILRSNPDGSKLLLKDVARIEVGSKDYSFGGTVNGKPAVMIAVYQQPGANALNIAENVEKTMQGLSKNFPEGVAYDIPYDTTKFIKVSINGVVKTLFEAIILVILVVYLFLQNFRATLIPIIAVPVSLIGTFAGMYLLGFSINTLTLFGMVLAIGIVVDDAIVVLENVERIMQEKKIGAREATYQAMQEVTGPIIAMTLVMCAVFIPVGFLGGMTGQLYKQFAITIAVSVTISGIVALTLTPTMCAMLLKPGHHEPARFFRWFNRVFDRLTDRYGRGVSFLLRRAMLACTCFIIMIIASIGLMKTVPTGLVPPEDQGIFVASVQMPDAASLSRTMKEAASAERNAMSFEGTENVITLSGFDMLTGTMKPSAATLFIALKDWDVRGAAQNVGVAIRDFFIKNHGNREAAIFAFNPPPIPGLGTTGGFEFFIQNKGEGGIQELNQVTQKFIAIANQQPELSGVSTLLRTNVPQILIDVDRERAKALNVPINSIFDAMQATFGSLYVNDFNKFGQTYRVLLQSEAEFRMRPEDIGKVFVRSGNGDMVPLKTLVRTRTENGPELVSRFNGFTGAKLMGNPATGYSSGQAIAAMERVATEVLPANFDYAWTGSAFQEKRVGNAAILAFVFGIIMVFMILAAQYEKWSMPLAVLMAVPFALFGALVAVWLRGLNIDIYFQIGLVTLIGLAAKNAILIVEFAMMLHKQGMNLVDAAKESARLRFRPIIMTSMAFILGVLPLALSFGAGANGQHSIGTGVIGGMIAATFIAVFFIPLFFVLISRFSEKKDATRQEGH